jgi:hypothetical protein
MKNWTLISKPIKEQARGLANYLNYLVNADHPNHKNKTKIIPIYGSIDNLYKKIVYSVAERNLARSKKRKGGREVSSFAQSYVCTLPEQLPKHPNHSDWQYITVELLKTIQAFTNVSSDELKNNIFINIHDQKNPHLNIVVSKILDNVVKTELQKKSIVSALKKTFNYAVLHRLKISPSDYQPLTKRRKRYNSDYYQKNNLFINHISRIKSPLPEHKLTYSKKSTVSKPKLNSSRGLN